MEQQTLKEAALSFDTRFCIFCEKKLKDSRSRMCRNCWKEWYKENPNRAFGIRNVNWKGNKVKYFALHSWIRRHKPKRELCEICKKNPPKQLANISGRYKRDVNDFQWLCIKCHVYKDGTVNNLFIHRIRKEELKS